MQLMKRDRNRGVRFKKYTKDRRRLKKSEQVKIIESRSHKTGALQEEKGERYRGGGTAFLLRQI